MDHQRGIDAALPPRGRYLQFHTRPDANFKKALEALRAHPWNEEAVIGFGPSVFQALNKELPGLRAFPVFDCAKVEVPSTPAAVWCFLRGSDPGLLLHQGRRLCETLAPAFSLSESVDSFQFKEGRDLSDYIDGTENPESEKVPQVAFVQGRGVGIDAGAFVSVQRWEHDLSRFSSWPEEERDNVIGRRHSDNEELSDAPASAHVKRTAQESFQPEAFILRRSMPYTCGKKEGLMFVAFGATLDSFDAQLKRMVGAEDGIVDALFRFSTPMSGAHFFCPPTYQGKLDLRALL